MKKILIATYNQAKLKEIKFGLRQLEEKGVQFVSLDDLQVFNQLEETGETFCENAILKAKFYGKITHLPTVADDGGLMIVALGNKPGVKSKRWLGYEADDEKLINHTLKCLNEFPKRKRVAYLQACVCFFDPKTKKTFFEEERIKGHIAQKPSRKATQGYPFRALFIVDKFNKYYDELTRAEHKVVNHRLKALKRLTTKIDHFLLK